MEFPNRDSNLDSTRHFQQIQSISSGASLQPVQSSPGPNQDCTCLLQEIKTRFTERASGASSTSPVLFPTSTQVKPLSECKELQPQQCSVNQSKEYKLEPKSPPSQSQVEALIAVKEALVVVPSGRSPTGEPLPASHFDCGVQSATAVSGKHVLNLVIEFTETMPRINSIFPTIVFMPVSSSALGIEAPDLTSLLEQFEETQGEPSVYLQHWSFGCSSPTLCNPFFHSSSSQQKRKEWSPPWN